MFKKVSIIIPAFNEEQFIGRCLQSLLDLDRSNLDLELIVIDNGSKDKTVDIAKEYGAFVWVKPGVKVAALRNYGVTISKGDLLAFVDADCTVSKDWLTQAIQCVNRESADAVGSFHMIPNEANWIGKTASLVQRNKIGLDVNYIPSGNMLVRRASFSAVGGFDESLETSEDVDLCHKLRQKGYKLFIDPRICSVHWGTPIRVKDLFLREMWHGKTMCTVFFRDLQGVRNLRLVLYAGVNLILYMSLIAGIFLLISGYSSLFLISLSLYLLLNLVLTLRDWFNIKENFIPLFFYIMIYGIARSFSMFKWILVRTTSRTF